MSNLRFDQPTWAPLFSDQLIIAQSTRLGGVSPEPYTSLNLGLHTQDAKEHAIANRSLFCEGLGCTEAQLAGGYQVHGNRVQVVTEAGQVEGYDAFVTNIPNLVLSATIADCTPVLLYDPVRGAVGAVHAGWRGTGAKIATKTVQVMQVNFGTRPADCWAYIGTCIGANDFEVDADVADHFAARHKRFVTKKEKFLVDLKAANRDQLLAAGLLATQIECSPFSTVANNERYFSHRKERGKTGRMLAVIGLRDSTKIKCDLPAENRFCFSQ